MIMNAEQSVIKAKEQFDGMLELVRQSASEGRAIADVEQALWDRLLWLGRSLLTSFVERQGTGDLGPTLECDGRILKRLDELHPRRYVSIFGEMAIPRTVYGTREAQKHESIPLDARLDLPDSHFSYVLQDWTQALCVKNSFAEGRQTIERILHVGQSVRSLEHMSQAMSASVEAFHQEQAPPPAEEEESILVLTADGKGVPTRREASAAPAPVRRGKGEKANQKREACVGGIYSIAPFVRTADDIVDEVLRKAKSEQRPAPQGKRLRAELTREIEGEERRGKDAIFAWLAAEAQARIGPQTQRVVCVMDGARALWKAMLAWMPGALCVLDIFHALERLWSAAHCFFPENSPEAEEFVAERLRRLLEGQAGRVIGGLKQMRTKQKLTAAKRKQLSAAITYLENNRAMMPYDVCLREGLPIGSGVVEGACRHLVKDRMELTGMRWRTEGAQAMLSLRAVYLNGDWDEFQQARRSKERDKLYPDRELIMAEWPEAA